MNMFNLFKSWPTEIATSQKRGTDAFISHSSLDKPFVCALVAALKHLGHPTWYDSDEIGAHKKKGWREQIEKSI
jgi:TIR domain